MMKYLRIGYNVVIGFIALIALMLIISALPIKGNIQFLSVLSGSMEPSISTGAVVLVKPMASYAIGDVITFREDASKTSISHRIIASSEANGQTVYTTKGDANDGPDIKPVPADKVIGKVLLDVPLAGYAVDFARKPIGLLLLVLIPVIAISLSEIRKIWSEISRIRNEKKKIEKAE